ncbi:MAG: hypothetical protein K2Q25_12110 [Mycobacteriaceae bacterium]|nr:hypothetical protein [Mycobacteriaceae bacterium]
MVVKIDHSSLPYARYVCDSRISSNLGYIKLPVFSQGTRTDPGEIDHQGLPVAHSGTTQLHHGYFTELERLLAVEGTQKARLAALFAVDAHADLDDESVVLLR